ncbi:phosphatase PAP2 family protein [Paeniglutamicibacter kerguelensis]|uniref:Undecaprenyl-diphosphatase n=1 Tax=Paeniglutamicibacter kerguelensis TaxID=254788 RepID=A0ABS4XC66_9MICC|nr:phosphatase PAP2 family protein [Paeniglutamicibacter kerguelensis]MBP2386062.1 undecaprenyl-diphosphatase [Paeniglutamicibacter kerguelensis]
MSKASTTRTADLGSQFGERMRMLVLPQLKSRVLIPAAMLALVPAVGFSAKFLPGYSTGELAVDQQISRHHDTLLNEMALLLSTIFSPLGGAILPAAICLFLLLLRRSPVNAIGFGAVASVGWLSSQVFKVIVARPRPNPTLLADPLAPETGFDSFPSGHVCLAVGLAFAVYYLASGTRWRNAAVIRATSMVVALALSRIYIGVHYPTDVVAAVSTASAAVMFFSGLWNRHAARTRARLRFLERFGPIPLEPHRYARECGIQR